jgi:hypothetical protein
MDETLKNKRGAILAVARRYRLERVRVFGSAARGELKVASDVDLLAEFPEGFSLFDHAAAQRDLAAVAGRPVDLVSEAGLRPRVRQRVMGEAVPL